MIVDAVTELKAVARKGFTSALGRNVLSLYALQFANYVLPLVTVPYLVRVLGPAKFGLVSFGGGLIAYCSLIINYGFDWSATRRIAINRADKMAVLRVANSVWAAKGLLCVGTFASLMLSIALVPKLRDASGLLLILYIGVAGNVLFPTWLFQGMERMTTISLIYLGVRYVAALGILVFIHKPGDYMSYAALLALQGMASGLLGLLAARRAFDIFPRLSTWNDIRFTFAEGSALFLTTAAVSFYTSGNAFILGMLTSPTIVGYYSAAERIVIAVVGLLGPLSQAAYPRFSRLARESKEQALSWGRKMLAVSGTGGLLLSLGLFLGGHLLVRTFLGRSYEPSVNVLTILSLLPFLIAISNVLGVQLLFPFGHERAVLGIAIIASVTNVALACLLAPRWAASGMALSVLISEGFVTGSYFTWLWRVGLNPLLES